MATTRELKLDVGKYYATWIEQTKSQLGSFTKHSLKYSEQDKVEFIERFKTFEADVLRMKLVEDTYPMVAYYKVPASWWQMLKKQYAPKWFKQRYPVKTLRKSLKRVVKLTRWGTLPQANISLPKKTFGPVVLRDEVEVYNA
jgi:hypothetical protein